jgi:DNA-binding transcriptional regulator GbsR (MarR family)
MSEERPRRDDGTFEKTVTEQAILKALDTAEEPVMTAKEIANELDASNVVVGERLNEMHDSGLVGRKKTGARAVAWWTKVEPRPDDVDVEEMEASDFRGILETDKSASELLDEAREEDRDREERLIDAATDE